MLVTCVDLVKSRLGAMDGEARKLFIFILAQLIEKSPVRSTLKMLIRYCPRLYRKFILLTNHHNYRYRCIKTATQH